MFRPSIFLLFASLSLFWLSKASAEGLPIFDAHIHYNQPDWSVYSPETIFGFLDQAGVRWAMVSSTPDEGTLRLFDKDPKRIVPILRPYRTQGDMGTWMKDSSILPKDPGERLPEFLFFQIAMDTCREMTDYGPLHHHRLW